MYTLLLLPPTRHQNRIYQRQSLKTPKNKLSKKNSWGKYKKFLITPKIKSLPSVSSQEVSCTCDNKMPELWHHRHMHQMKIQQFRQMGAKLEHYSIILPQSQ